MAEISPRQPPVVYLSQPEPGVANLQPVEPGVANSQPVEPDVNPRARSFVRRPDGSYIYDWDGPNDPKNPFNWPRWRKWILTLAVLLVSINFALPAGAYGSGNMQMNNLWHASKEIDENGRVTGSFPHLYWATASWNMGAALFPLLFVPLTESTGRMPGYFGAYVVFLICLIPCALSDKFSRMVVARFFGGGASSVAINIVGGTITDIWQGARGRSVPMSLFGTTCVVGIALGPVLGTAITSYFGDGTDTFRYIYWLLLLYNGVLLVPYWFILTETRGDIILAREARAYRASTRLDVWTDGERNKESMGTKLKVSFYRPIRMLFTEFAVASFTLWVSFAWGILFLFTSSVTQTITKTYHFDSFRVTLFLLAICVGAIVATLVNIRHDQTYFRLAGISPDSQQDPGARLSLAITGSFIFAFGLFWYGLAVWDKGGGNMKKPLNHWVVPALGIMLVGIGIYSIYLGVVNYLTDSYEKYATSALSAASLGRNVFGAFLPFASPVMYHKLAFLEASFVLGAIALILTLAPIILVWQGDAIRKRSPFMKESSFTPAATEKGEVGVERFLLVASV